MATGIEILREAVEKVNDAYLAGQTDARRDLVRRLAQIDAAMPADAYAIAALRTMNDWLRQ